MKTFVFIIIYLSYIYSSKTELNSILRSLKLKELNNTQNLNKRRLNIRRTSVSQVTLGYERSESELQRNKRFQEGYRRSQAGLEASRLSRQSEEQNEGSPQIRREQFYADIKAQNKKDVKTAHEMALVLKRAKGREHELNEMTNGIDQEEKSEKLRYHMDPVFNVLRSRNRRKDSSSLSLSSSELSSSLEVQKFKEMQKKKSWQKQYEALMLLNRTGGYGGGDQVNMVAARPWGVKCSEPGKKHVVHGTCVLAMECEPELRIFRGDSACGKTSFVCCAIEENTFAMYQAFDPSFEDEAVETSLSQESLKKKREKYRKKLKKQALKEKERRRKRRKKKIKDKMDSIVRQIRKILDETYRNATKEKKKKTEQLEKYVKDLKKQYKNNKDIVKDFHFEYLLKVDRKLMEQLKAISKFNKNIITNKTIADILVNGTMTVGAARMLAENFPQLRTFLPIQFRRRSEIKQDKSDKVDYDVEYGFLYY